MAKDKAYPYDVTLTADGTTYGFMLAVGEGGKQLQIGEVPGPQTSRVRTELQATYFDFDPRYDTPFVMSDWSGGLGQLDFDQGLPNRYLWGEDVMTHVGGMAYLRPASIASGQVATDRDLSTWNLFSFRRWLKYMSSSDDDYYFMLAADRVYGGTNPWDVTDNTKEVYDANFDTINSMVVFGGTIYFTAGVTGQNVYKVADPTASTWSVSTINADTIPLPGPRDLCVVGDTMFAGAHGTGRYNKIYFTTDPDSNSWVGPIVVGDESSAIMSLRSVNDFLFVIKEDSIYSIDQDQNVTEVVWQWNLRPSDKNFDSVSSYKGMLVFNIENEVFYYDPVTGRIGDVGLARLDALSIATIRGLGGDNAFLYVLAKLSVPSAEEIEDEWSVLRGYETDDGWAWESVYTPFLSSDPDYLDMEVMPGSPAYPNSTVIYLIDGEDNWSEMVALDSGWNTSEQTSLQYSVSGKLYTSITRDNFPGLQKRRLYLSMVTDQCAPSGTFPARAISAAYSTDGGTTFTHLGKADTDGLHTFSFSGVHSDTITLRFAFESDFTATPRLLEFDLHSRPRYRYLQTVGASVRVADRIERRNQSQDKITQQDIRDALEALRIYEGEIIYRDYLGHEFPVSIDSIEYTPTVHQEPEAKTRRDELMATILMARADKGA